MSDKTHEGYNAKSTNDHMSGLGAVQQYLQQKFISEALVSEK